MSDTGTERAALALFEELIDIRESDRDSWIAARTLDPAVKARLAAMIAADRISSLGTGAAAMTALGPAPERIGAYRITGLIGRGGMGAVYRATRDVGDFDLDVAIKIIKPGLLSEQLAVRLATERQTLAGMNHPNIARLFDGGTLDDGAPYIIMELIDGRPADRWAKDKDTRTRVALLITAARAVAHAHQRLIIHRDITPANVLVTQDGTLKLIDFGIARAADEATTTATDVYGLGRLATRLLPEPELELAAIIARATAENPASRYPTADALADDLAAWADGRVVTAMNGGRRYAIAKFVGRHRWQATASAGALVLLVGALIAVLIANRQARSAEADSAARFQQTRAVAKALLFPVYDKVARVSGSTAAKAELAQTGLAYLDALAASPDAPHDLKVEAGRGFVRLAEVTGGGQAGQLGRYADANALLARAETLLAPAYAARPGDLATVLAFAALRLEQAGTNLYNNNAAGPARAQANEAEAALRPLSTRDAESATLYATALQAVGDSYGWNDDYAGAFPHHVRAEAFLAGLPPALAGDDRVQGARSGNLRLLAEAAHKTAHIPGRAALARQSLENAVAINRTRLAREPDDPGRLRKLATALWYAGVVHRTNNRSVAAETASREAVAVGRRLVARDAADAGALHLLALTAEFQAQLLADAGDKAGNAAIAAEMLAAHDQLVRQAGSAPGARRSRAASLRTQGGNRWNLRDTAGACRAWRDALGTYDALAAANQLSTLDANNARPELTGLVRDLCDSANPKWRKVDI
ncbi:serine/threonine-protein kinase [Sandarakinorhabdus sp.]|uniref:serine/threonine-protein kinase n=1 Tax=Sandarakinorhabdus sp. TaxID=1916663 RepID=UPI00286DCD66|nr:serine/threonine-protein kinase [Sandarakinorhabdus sp.]